MDSLKNLKLVDSRELVNDEGIALALIKIRHYDVILWGAGYNGYSVLRQLLEIYDIRPLCIVDSDVCKSGLDYWGIQVIHPSEMEKYVKNPSNTYALIAAGIYLEDHQIRNDIDQKLDETGIFRKQYMPLWKYAAKPFDAYLLSHEEEINWVNSILADEESKITLKEWIRCCLQADCYLLPEHKYRYKYWGCDFDGNDELYTHLEDEVFVNCGSNIGDTIFQFLAKGYSFDKIHAYEGDAVIFPQLRSNIALLDKEMQKNIELHYEYIGVGENGFDVQFGNKRVTLINADIEGAELDVLRGMKGIIREQEPVIAFCVYHKPDDFVSIPKFILDTNHSYRIYFRKYVNTQRNRYELVMYAVPRARCLK